MIAWHHPIALAALILIPLLGVFFAWALRERERALARFVEAALLPIVAPDVDRRRRRVRAVLLVAAAACLVVALGGPKWGFHWEEVRREGLDLVVALDTSKSMLATDVQPHRLARAKLAVQDLLAELQGDRVALVAFAGTAFTQCPLTLDHGAFRESLDAVEVGLIPRGGTNLTAALRTALAAFEGRQGKHQALVLITDGEAHEGEIDGAITELTERGVKAFTIGIGTAEGELIPLEGGGFLKDRKGQVVKSRLDEATLKKIALETGGVYLHAAGMDLGLGQLYREHIATLEKRELASTLEKRFEHRFQIPLGLGLLLLVIEALVGERRREPARRRTWRRETSVALLVAAAFALTGAGWLDPHATAREAARLYDEGKYEESAAKYTEALIDDPDSVLLHLNLGAARYRQGKFEEAATALDGVVANERDASRAARAAYGVGNAKYRLGAAVEGSKPHEALTRWGEALAAYRRAMGADPGDEDAKFNHEFVASRIADLRKKLEEQQKEQPQEEQQQQRQPPQDQQQPEPQQDTPPEQDQQNDQPEDDQPQNQDPQQKPSEAQEAPSAPEEQPPQEQPSPQPGEPAGDEADRPSEDAAAGAAAGEATEEMSPEEAEALLDTQRDQELRPDEMLRRLEGAQVGEAREDW